MLYSNRWKVVHATCKTWYIARRHTVCGGLKGNNNLCLTHKNHQIREREERRVPSGRSRRAGFLPYKRRCRIRQLVANGCHFPFKSVLISGDWAKVAGAMVVPSFLVKGRLQVIAVLYAMDDLGLSKQDKEG
jgi:hypothetical protein